MTFHSVILTSGTSALAPFNLAGSWLKAQADVVQSVGQPARWSASAGVSPEEALEAVTKRLHQLPALADPMKVSAEYSLLHALQKERSLGKSPRITLVATDTLDGRLASACVRHLIEREFGAYVEESLVADFNVDERRRFQQGLGNVLAKISEALRNHDASSTCFAPVGGFKVMTSLAYLLGCFHGYPSMYLHETLQVLHAIPAVPVHVSPEELEPVAPLVRRMVLEGSSASVVELSQDEQSKYALGRFGWLFEQLEGRFFSLNAMGIFLAQNPEYLSVLGPRVLLSDRAAKVLDAHKDTVGQELRELVNHIAAESGTINSIYHEKDWSHRVKGTMNWRLAKQPVGTIRVIWKEHPESGALYVNQIWTDHDDYEKNAPHELSTAFDPLISGAWRDLSERIYSVRT